jgi:hypothetical protein
MLNAVMLNVAILNAVILNVVMLITVKLNKADCCYAEYCCADLIPILCLQRDPDVQRVPDGRGAESLRRGLRTDRPIFERLQEPRIGPARLEQRFRLQDRLSPQRPDGPEKLLRFRDKLVRFLAGLVENGGFLDDAQSVVKCQPGNKVETSSPGKHRDRHIFLREQTCLL